MVICLERSADLHMAQLMPLPLTVSCFSKIQIGFTFLVPAHPGSPGKRAAKRVCVCVCIIIIIIITEADGYLLVCGSFATGGRFILTKILMRRRAVELQIWSED